MTVYLDSSALVKLVVREAETAALREHLLGLRAEHLVSSVLARVEVVRAVRPVGPDAVDRAHRRLAVLHLVPLDRSLLDEAARAGGPGLRSLEAIHLAAARRLGPTLRHVVTYDARMRTAAHGLGMATEAPG